MMLNNAGIFATRVARVAFGLFIEAKMKYGGLFFLTIPLLLLCRIYISCNSFTRVFASLRKFSVADLL